MPGSFQAKDRLADYVDVKERIRLFYAAHPDGRLVTDEVSVSSEPDGIPRVLVRARAYRSPEDPLPGVGWSWMTLPGKTPYTNGSEIENTETSAWGRAIGALGIGIEKSIASADEVRAKDGQEEQREEQRDDGGLIGKVEFSKDNPDFMPRMGPEGHVLAFRLTSSRGGIKVIAKEPLASVLPQLKDEVVGQRVTCWGKLSEQEWTPRGAKTPRKYLVLDLERIQTPSWTLPRFEEEAPPPPDPGPMALPFSEQELDEALA